MTYGTPAKRTGRHSQGRHSSVTVDNTSHNIQLDRPEIVLDKIKELLR